MRAAVVGAGISGLAAAWELSQHADVTVFDPRPVGGCLRTTEFAGHPVDEGADAFLTRVPDAMELCRQIGIEAELVAPSTGRAAIWFEGRLRELPEGMVLGVPRHLGRLAASGILSPAGVARAALDVVLPRRDPGPAPSVRSVVAGRFGTQVADRLVDPLLGGIHAGWTGELGAAEVAPQILEASRKSRSLLLGLRRLPPAPAGPVFMAPERGMGRLVDALVEALTARSVTFVAEAVSSVTPEGSGSVRVEPDPRPFDVAVVATPAGVAVALLTPGPAPGLDALRRLPMASVVLVTAAWTGRPAPAGLSGFLVPRDQGRLLTACSFGSNKWPHWADRGTTVVRLSAGRYGDGAALELEDDALVHRLFDELGAALGWSLAPSAVRVSRFPDAFPQYRSGHAGVVAEVERTVRGISPRVGLAGSAYRGSGIPACIASGRRAAASVVAAVQAGRAG